MQRFYQTSQPLGPFYNPSAILPGQGGPIDWARVSSFFDKGKYTVKLAAAALKGAVGLTVDALPHAVKHDTILDFGEEESVSVVIAAGGEAIGQTVLSVDALTGPIPNGTQLNFGAGENLVVLDAAAAEGATTITIRDALTIALEAGDTATYQGGRKLAKVTEDAEEGDTALVVEPLQFAIADDTESLADQTGSSDGKRIPQGTVMARSNDNGLLIPRRDGVVGDGETSIGFLVSDADEKSQTDSLSGYGIVVGGTPIYENLLPDADGSGNLSATYKTELKNDVYNFIYLDWEDSRVS